MDEQFFVEFFFLAESDFRRAGRDVPRLHSIIASHFISFESEIRFVIDDDRRLPTNRKEIARQAFRSLTDAHHFFRVDFGRLWSFRRLCPLPMHRALNGGLMHAISTSLRLR